MQQHEKRATWQQVMMAEMTDEVGKTTHKIPIKESFEGNDATYVHLHCAKRLTWYYTVLHGALVPSSY